MMDDLAACADLCESHGFAAPAAVLRALAGGRSPFFLVRALIEPEYAHYEGLEVADIAPAGRRVFLDRISAERHARELTVRALRNLRATRYASNFSDQTDDNTASRSGPSWATPTNFPPRGASRSPPPRPTSSWRG